jgi:NADH dehydrogenase
MEPPRIAVLGAGFAGLEAVRQLAGLARGGADVHLFDRHTFTTMIPALPDAAGGRVEREDVTEDISALVDAAVNVHCDAIDAVDLKARTFAAEGGEFRYDYLVIATGSVTNTHGFSQHVEDVHTLDTMGHADSIRSAFEDHLKASENPIAVIVGAGYTGLELACSLDCLAARRKKPARITVVELQDSILPGLEERVQNYMAKQCARRGIEIITETSVDTFDGSTVTLSNGKTLGNALLCWSTGTRRAPPELDGKHTERKDGRIEVSDTLQIPEHPAVFAAGDSAALRDGDKVLRKAVNFSVYSGRRAGENVVRSVRGLPLKPFSPVDLGWVIPFCDVAVGKVLGIGYVTGRLPLSMHYAMCGYRNFSLGNRVSFGKMALRALLGSKRTARSD